MPLAATDYLTHPENNMERGGATMAILISPDKKTQIPTDNPTEIVRLKAQGFTVKPESAGKTAAAEKAASQDAPANKSAGK